MKRQDPRPSLGQKLQKYRLRRGMSLQKLAGEARLAPELLIRFESDHRLPDHDQLARLAQALGRCPEQMMANTPYRERRSVEFLLDAAPFPETNPKVPEWMAMLKAGEPAIFDKLQAQLACRLDLENLSDALAYLPCHDETQVLLCLHLLAAGADPIQVSPLQLGLRTHVPVESDYRLHRGLRAEAGLHLVLDSVQLFAFPNLRVVHLRNGRRLLLDLLVGVQSGSEFLWGAVALAKKDPEFDQYVANELGLPLAVYDQQDLRRPDLIKTLEDDCIKAIGAQRLQFWAPTKKKPKLPEFKPRRPSEN
ncbi:MAG: helix-turn-helix transcriptional regulator [Candidatus Eremiobacteraeota bacterium]|nr:helix-turn-helix transcriptional regulator [Candidatus Eremiobacteraeota bacterium]